MHVRPAQIADAQRIAQLENQHYQQLWTTTPQAIEKALLAPSSHQRFVVTDGTNVLACAHTHPAEVPHALHVRFYAQTAALEARSLLLDHLLDHLPAGISLLESTLREDFTPARTFLEHAGFQNVHQSYGAHLDLSNFDFAPYEGLEERLFIEGFEVQDTPPPYSEALFQLYSEAHQDVPQVPATRWENPDREKFQAMVQKPNRKWFTVLYRGAVVALTVLDLHPHTVDTDLTLTSRRFRHRGLATLVKARSLQWAKAQGYREASTGGALVNLGMLKVNRRLGYVLEPMWLTFTRSI